MYKGIVKKNTGLFPTATTPEKMMRDYYEAQVFWNNEYVAKTGLWCEVDDKRRKAGLLRSANALAKRYQGYFDRTGKRFDVEEKEKSEAKRAAKIAERKRTDKIKSFGVESLDLLEEIVASIKLFEMQKDNEDMTFKVARADVLIAKAKGAL